MRHNLGEKFLSLDGTGAAVVRIGLSENGTNHSHLYFQAVMSFPCVPTNPLHQHLSHGEEGVQGEPEIDLKCVFGLYFNFNPVHLRLYVSAS